MSEPNVDRFVELIDAFNHLGDASDGLNRKAVRRWLGVMDSEIQFQPQQSALQGGYVGHEGALQWLADGAEHYANAKVNISDIRDLEDWVLALGTLYFTGKGSGIETEAPVAIVASFRNGLMTDFKDYGDKDRALEAVGLSE